MRFWRATRWAPAGTPSPVVQTLFDALTKVYADPEVAKANASIGVTMSLSTSPAEFSEFVVMHGSSAAFQAGMIRDPGRAVWLKPSLACSCSHEIRAAAIADRRLPG